MKLRLDLKMKFDNIFKYFIYGILYILVFYILIIKNIVAIYEIKDYIEAAESRNERLLQENETFKEKKAEIENRVKEIEEGKDSDKNIKIGKYFYNTGEIISFIDEIVARYDGDIISIKNLERNGNIVRVSIEISLEEERLMPFLYELESDDYGIFLLDKNLSLTVKKGDNVNLNMKLAVALSKRIKEVKESVEEKLEEDKVENFSNKKIFNLDTNNKSFMRIGNEIIYSRTAISKSEERRLKEELSSKNKKKKKATKKLSEIEKSIVNEEKVKNKLGE